MLRHPPITEDYIVLSAEEKLNWIQSQLASPPAWALRK